MTSSTKKLNPKLKFFFKSKLEDLPNPSYGVIELWCCKVQQKKWHTRDLKQVLAPKFCDVMDFAP